MMQTMAIIFSFACLMLLFMPLKITGMLCIGIGILLGAGLLIWKKPQQKRKLLSKASVLAAVLLSVTPGLSFYALWIKSSTIRRISRLLQIPVSVIILAAAIFLCIGSVYFLAGLLQQGHAFIKTLTAKMHLLARNLILSFIAALSTVCISQLMIDTAPMAMGLLKFLGGAAIVFFFILALYCISGEIRSSIVAATGVFVLLSVVNAYVYKFRGRLFEPVDIFSAGTAMNVAGSYNLLPPALVLYGLGLWGVLSIWIVRVTAKTKYHFIAKSRIVLSLCCLVGIASMTVCCANLRTHHWDKGGAINNGYILNFVAKFKELHVPEPKEYDPEALEQLSAQYPSTPTTAEKTPHIIVIMDEAFSDLGVLGDLNTDKPVAPFISSLKEDTISGYALASIYGGNTANSEFEFLTGHSMAWMTPNTVPYQQYLRSPAYSMVSYLKQSYAYRCIAMHPYLSSGWNRPTAYGNLGFDEMLFQEDFPQEQHIRNYISDQEMFEALVELYEKQKENPLFLFGVSMQNHGDYKYAKEDFTKSVSLIGYDKAYPEAEQYLSLIHETDKAVEYLISYFRQVDEEVVIVFFGDHQPRLPENFYQALGYSASGSLEQIQKKHVIPFFIWANYDIEEKFVEQTSLNYLSSYVYATAGISLPPYNRFLSEMEQTIPAINVNGFYSAASQTYLPFRAASETEQKWLSLYEKLQYNCLFDKKLRSEHFFPLPEQTQ